MQWGRVNLAAGNPTVQALSKLLWHLHPHSSRCPNPSFSPTVIPTAPLCSRRWFWHLRGAGWKDHWKHNENIYFFPLRDDQKLFFPEAVFQPAFIKIQPFLLGLESFYSPFSYVSDQLADGTSAPPGFAWRFYVICHLSHMKGDSPLSQVRGFNVIITEWCRRSPQQLGETPLNPSRFSQAMRKEKKGHGQAQTTDICRASWREKRLGYEQIFLLALIVF